MSFTEVSIQNRLGRWILRNRGHILCVPNYYFTAKKDIEADVISVTAAKFMHEYEIKVSKADFKADFTGKVEKHQMYAAAEHPRLRPNYFWYVCPEGLIGSEEVPDYAGLIYIRDDKRKLPWVKKKAPAIHKGKVSDRWLADSYKSCMWKLWNERLKWVDNEDQTDSKSNS